MSAASSSITGVAPMSLATTAASTSSATFPNLFNSTFSTPPAVSPSTTTTTASSSPGLTSSAALYLYTFLATLVLLLAVSSAIVIRSLVLRRRHQRLVEEAIRAGTWNPNQAYDPHSGRRRREIGEKPKLWETWLRNGEDGDNTTEKGRWDDIMPVHAAYLDLSSPSAPAPTNDPVSRSESPPRTSRFLRPFQRRAPPSPSPPVISPPIDSSSADISPRSRSPSPTVRLAVLIAMPSPPPQHTREDDGPPIVEIGITDVVVRDSDCEHTPDL